MKNLPVALRFIINVIFFVIYSLIGIIFGDFVYGLILSTMGKSVPGSSDPIHLKIAGVVIVIILIISIVFRKYFYLSCVIDKNDNIKIKNNEDLKIYVDKEIK